MNYDLCSIELLSLSLPSDNNVTDAYYWQFSLLKPSCIKLIILYNCSQGDSMSILAGSILPDHLFCITV